MRNFKRDRGYLVYAQNGKTDYLRIAYALALSLKATQSEVKDLSVAITPGMDVPEKYRAVFDEVIDIPWLDEARHSDWKLENEWKTYHFTPYRETVKLDADMLFTQDIAEWWPVLSRQDVVACTSVEDYRGRVATSDFYRKTFTANQLPNVYTGFMYFKYSDVAEQLFKMAEIIFQNWEKFFYEYLDEARPTYVSTDVVFALAIKLLDIEDLCTLPDSSVPRFIHMKSQLQGWPETDLTEDWTSHVTATVTDDLDIKIGLHRLTKPFHYHVKSFLTDDIIKTYERKLGIE